MEVDVRRICVSISYWFENHVYSTYKEGPATFWGPQKETQERLEKIGLDSIESRDEEIIKRYKKDFDAQIKKQLCDDIMSGKIKIDYSVNDLDCYDIDENNPNCPLYIL